MTDRSVADALVPWVDGVNSIYFTGASVLPTPQGGIFIFKYPQWVPRQPAMVTSHGSGPKTGWLTKKSAQKKTLSETHMTFANIPHIYAFGDLMYRVSMCDIAA